MGKKWVMSFICRRALYGLRDFAVISFVFLCSCYRYFAPEEQNVYFGQNVIIGVRLSVEQNDIKVKGSQGLIVVTDGISRQISPTQVVILDRQNDEIVVRVSVDRKVSGQSGMWRRTKDTVFFFSKGMIDVEGRRYRGEVKAFIIADTGLVVVNRVQIEEYLYGVIPAEIGPIDRETLEAVKAQAVAARSFTLSRLKIRRGLGYELYDIYMRDQEYRGADGEVVMGRKAVDETKGEVLIYQDDVALALYHGNCGGVTADGSEPYLRAVYDTPGNNPKAAPFCAQSKNFFWKRTVSQDSVERLLMKRKNLKIKPRVRSFRLEKDRLAKRVKTVRFLTNQGDITVEGSELRFALGLKSTYFNMKFTANQFVFEGKGWGHGVGLCQDGALAMARNGYRYRQILRHYYPGLRIKKVY
ncbi:MAG: SpoIID/LytB domain-containing protein [bacterium]